MNHLLLQPFKKTAMRSLGLQGGQLRLEFKWWGGGTAISQALQPHHHHHLNSAETESTDQYSKTICRSIRLSVCHLWRKEVGGGNEDHAATDEKAKWWLQFVGQFKEEKRGIIRSKHLRVNIDQFQWWNHLPEHKAICKKSKWWKKNGQSCNGIAENGLRERNCMHVPFQRMYEELKAKWWQLFLA